MLETDCTAAISRTCPSLDEAVSCYLGSILSESLSEAGTSADLDCVRNSLADALLDYDVAQKQSEADSLCEDIALALQISNYGQPNQSAKDAQLTNDASSTPTHEQEQMLGRMKEGDEVFAVFDDELWHPASVERVNVSSGEVEVKFRTQRVSRQVDVSKVKMAAQLSTLAEIVDTNSRVKDNRMSKRDKVRLEARQTVESFREPTHRKLKKEQKAKEREELAKRVKAKSVKLRINAGNNDVVTPSSSLPSSSMVGNKDIVISDFSLPPLGGGADLLSSSSLRLAFGRRYGLIGRNGIGKSTLLKSIARKEIKGFPQGLRVLHVEQEISGNDDGVLDYVVKADVERQQLLEEEKMLSTAVETEADANTTATSNERLVAIYNRLKEIDAWSAEARAGKILTGLQFSPEMQKQATRSLSGGWRMRVALATALFLAPDVLLLDEPTNHLDFPAVLWLENYLINFPCTLLLVSHDRMFVNNCVTDIIHFYNGELAYYRGDFDSFETRRAEILRCQQKQFEGQERKRKHIQSFIDRFRFNAKRASLVQSRIKALDKLGFAENVEEDAAFRFEFPEPERLQKHVLQLDNVDFAYTPDRMLLRQVNVRVDMDSRVAVIGSNGAGKSTLVNLMLGKLECVSGFVTRNPNARISLFAQHHMDQLDLSMTPLEYLISLYPSAPKQHLRSHLGRFGVSGDLALQIIATLSGGQKSRVAFANITYTNPHFLILDEPTNHLDLETVDALVTALSVFSGGCLLISHDQHALKSSATEFWSLREGQVTTFDSFEKAKRNTFASLQQ